MPTILMGYVHYTYQEILSPDTVRFFKGLTQDWPDWMIEKTGDIAVKLCSLMEKGYVDNEFNSIDIEDSEIIDLIHSKNDVDLSQGRKLMVRKLVQACFTVCLLSTITYTGICGTELSIKLFSGKFERRE